MRFYAMAWSDGLPHVGEVRSELGAACYLFRNPTAAAKFYLRHFVADMPSLASRELPSGREVLLYCWSLPPSVRVFAQVSAFADSVAGSLLEVAIPFRSGCEMFVLITGDHPWLTKTASDCPRAYWFRCPDSAREFAATRASYVDRVRVLPVASIDDAKRLLSRLPPGCELEGPDQPPFRLPVEREPGRNCTRIGDTPFVGRQ